MDIRSSFESLDKKFTGFGGLNGGGITRLLYSDEWSNAVHELKRTLEKEGFEASFDSIGNLKGRIEGSKYPEETIMSGSHIDTVVEGGHLDGQFGVLAALVAMQSLKAEHGQPLRSLEVLALAEEEGSRFPYAFWGSKNFFNLANREDVNDIADGEGINFKAAMNNAGFDYRSEDNDYSYIKSFIEVHIEQGKVLETEKKAIGVVNGIVGQKRYTINLKGEANHAGTTPMGLRRDAVVAFSKIATELTDKARAIGDPLVITFGRVDPVPNTVNVVPGEVTFSIDCRHIDQAALNDFAQTIDDCIKTVSEQEGVEYDINLWMDEAPTMMDESLVKVVEQAAEQVVGSNDSKIMPSGAGHDSQIFAKYLPTAMLFVPSINGVSHNVTEETNIEDLVKGIEVLKQVLYQLAYKE
ncbi:allantoate deiminase [Staphylococcus pseudoxylosus]|uniref:allantoate deiminase n=1 Tax=Staphylococcus pseudoxylosus TaxID=2282419 RepID=UPI000D1D1DF1|nr:allantoate deiminase [Staphylococcus pseudoxylosus]PTI44505.1 allantoate amidohydrolase [Staphylococcus xylosus]MDW8797211.1 allantoate deiminase [Staphylococcus pseudoxylosus]MEB6044672.1 allantoate deiminase [Staphylococcus pseudoxylosus]MEB8008926.1 allantoate deiminase [Staphylococcus pseudoxylosus]MEB8085579.1 allantoate deiminase [Staphylococcus pseudoxylosus]